MSKNHRSYDSDYTIRVMEKIEGVLHERGVATVYDLMIVTELSANRVGEFLREMKKRGTAVCVERSRKLQGGSMPARWGPGTATEDLPEKDDMPRVVIVRKQWEPSHVRMGLECYLFGIPELRTSA